MAKTAAHGEPRKRPSQARSVAAVAAMVEAAARIIEVRGWTALTTNHVAELSGVSIGSLYQYFPSKEALLAELVRRERAMLLHDVGLAMALEGELPFAIQQGVMAGLAHQFRRPALALALESAPSSPSLQREDEALRQALADQLAGLLARHGVADPDMAAADVIALCRGIIDAAALRGETDMASLARRLGRAVHGYLDARGPAREAAASA